MFVPAIERYDIQIYPYGRYFFTGFQQKQKPVIEQSKFAVNRLDLIKPYLGHKIVHTTCPHSTI